MCRLLIIIWLIARTLIVDFRQQAAFVTVGERRLRALLATTNVIGARTNGDSSSRVCCVFAWLSFVFALLFGVETRTSSASMRTLGRH